MERGRPTKFKQEYIEQARKLTLLGATNDQLCDFFGVGNQTLHNWMNKNSDFMDAIKSGKAEADAQVEKALFKKAVGYTSKKSIHATYDGKITDIKEVNVDMAPDTTAQIFWLKNRKPEEWRDKREISASVQNETTVLEPEERRARVEELLKKK